MDKKIYADLRFPFFSNSTIFLRFLYYLEDMSCHSYYVFSSDIIFVPYNHILI
jgi:hypothetical protein